MGLYDALVEAYNHFLTFFPPDIHWVVTLAIIMVMIGFFVALIRQNILFGFLLLLLVPVFWPVIMHFFTDLGNFFVYLLHTAHETKP